MLDKIDHQLAHRCFLTLDATLAVQLLANGKVPWHFGNEETHTLFQTLGLQLGNQSPDSNSHILVHGVIFEEKPEIFQSLLPLRSCTAYRSDQCFHQINETMGNQRIQMRSKTCTYSIAVLIASLGDPHEARHTPLDIVSYITMRSRLPGIQRWTGSMSFRADEAREMACP